jgi:cytochrome c551/c552
MKKTILFIVGGMVALALLIQLVPYGRAHTNPPVIQDAPWPSPEAKAIAQRACYDCHSNESVWPWYSNIAPFSWLVQHDVEEARGKINFSEWGTHEMELDEVQEVLNNGEMPPMQYLLIHTNASLSDADKQTLLTALQQMGGGGD